MRIFYFSLFLFLFACKENVDSFNFSKENEVIVVVGDVLEKESIDDVIEAHEEVQESSEVNAQLDVSDNAAWIDLNYLLEKQQNHYDNSVDEEIISPQMDFPSTQVATKNEITEASKIQQQASNILPTASDDSIVLFEDEVVILDKLLSNDQGLDGDDLMLIQFSQAKFGLVVFINEKTLKYIPFSNFNGKDSFNYTMSDGKGGEALAQVDILVKSVNDSPIAKSDSFVVSQGRENTIDVILNDEGVGDGITLSIQSQPKNGRLTVQKNNTLSFRSSSDYFGADSFVYQLKDADGEVSLATVALNVECFDMCTRIFNISWKPSISSGVTAYRVYVGTVMDQLDRMFDIGDLTNFDYPVSQKGEYFFAISALNSEGIESELSQIIKGVF